MNNVERKEIAKSFVALISNFISKTVGRIVAEYFVYGEFQEDMEACGCSAIQALKLLNKGIQKFNANFPAPSHEHNAKYETPRSHLGAYGTTIATLIIRKNGYWEFVVSNSLTQSKVKINSCFQNVESYGALGKRMACK